MSRLRVYYLPNGDGIYSYLVAARNQKEAVKLIGTTLGSFRAYGGQRTDREEQVEIAMSEPGVVWKRKIDVYPQPWLKAYPSPAGGSRT